MSRKAGPRTGATATCTPSLRHRQRPAETRPTGPLNGLLVDVPTYEPDIGRIESMIQDIRAIRDRTCKPKDRSNPRYHALSAAVSGLMKAASDMRTEDKG